MENHACMCDWVARVVFVIQMPPTFGGHCNHYFWEIRVWLKILWLPNFKPPPACANKIFQKWTVFVFNSESWSHDHCNAGGLLSRFGPFYGQISALTGFCPYLWNCSSVKNFLEIPLSHESKDPSWLSIAAAFLCCYFHSLWIHLPLIIFFGSLSSKSSLLVGSDERQLY